MKPPLYVRALTLEERQQLVAGLHSSDAFTLRRCQILLASARGQRPATIARNLGCATQSVRNALHAFDTHGLAALHAQSRRPQRTRLVLHAAKREQLRALLHQSPRTFGKPRSTWTLALAAEVCWTGPHALPGQPREHPPSSQTFRCALAAGQGLDHQPRSAVCTKKKRRDRVMQLAMQHPDWVLGFADEAWWSRLAHPPLHAWADQHPLRLVEHARAKDDPDPQALCCYGLLRTDRMHMLLRFVEGRPVSRVTIAFLAWLVQQMATEHKHVLVIIWDNASWHLSREVRTWIRQHNQQVKRHGGVRLLTCRLPVKSPWLNPIEPRWVHGKRAVVEPDRLLTAPELISRVYAHFGTEPLEPLQQHVA